MTESKLQCKIGMIGLGVMGQNLLLNMSDHGIAVAGFDKDPTKVAALQQLSQGRDIYSTTDLKEFIHALQSPRAIMLLVPAGAAVDAVINELTPLLKSGDIIIDAGNSFFKDTDVRARNLNDKGIQFLGVGVSGGEDGARHGPSIMPGGPKQAYAVISAIFEAVAAKVNNKPCVSYIGPGSAGHYVKMVHNGIEYAIMQLIAETYDVMQRGFGMQNQQLSDIYATWNSGKLNSYLIDITSKIFAKRDAKTTKYLIDEIVSESQQTGTGMWTSQSAMELQVPIPTIDLAVAMRDLSIYTQQRAQANKLYNRAITPLTGNKEAFITQLENALFTTMLIAYAQGMALLTVASDKYQYQLDLAAIAQVWSGGCIIRAAMLTDFAAAFQHTPSLPNLLLAPKLAQRVIENEGSLRKVVCQASELGIAMPCFMVSLSYLDAYSSLWMPANLVQAQRDFFGSHRYARIDTPGTFHTNWEQEENNEK